VLSAVVWSVLGLASATAIAVGVRLHRPARKGPWLLLGGSVLAMGIGEACHALDVHPSADVAYYAMFSLVALTLLQFTDSTAPLVDRARLIDLLAFTCAALLGVWVFAVGCTGLTVSAPDTLGDIVLLIVTGRLAITSGRNRSATLLSLGAAGLLVGDLTHDSPLGPASEAGHAVYFLAWGAAALHPSMNRLARATVHRPPPWHSRWTALLGLSVATPPTVLLIQAMHGAVTDGVAIAVAAGSTLTLTIARLADSLDQHSRALERERHLREASAALVAAADVPSVDHALRAAVARLLPGDAHRLILAADDRHVTGRAQPSAGAVSRSRSWWQNSPPTEPETTLICPLWPEPFAVSRPGGALIVAGHHDQLAATRDALEVLAGQAALALDRISLVAAAEQRDIDSHLQTMVRTSSDVVLVVDDQQRVRHASPALNAILGTTLSPLQTLQDLVIPDDRGTVSRTLLAADGDGVVFCALQRPDGGQVLVEATFRDQREDPLVQGFVISFRDLTDGVATTLQTPLRDHVEDLPAQVNRRSARDKFRY
jgi:PAS domain-containing protein